MAQKPDGFLVVHDRGFQTSVPGSIPPPSTRDAKVFPMYLEAPLFRAPARPKDPQVLRNFIAATYYGALYDELAPAEQNNCDGTMKALVDYATE